VPVSYEFLRGVLGIIGLACAYMAGRTAVAVRKSWTKPSKLYGWVIRATVCLAAIVFRHPVDLVAIVLWALAALAFGGAWYQAQHHKPPEDLTHEIFPDEP